MKNILVILVVLLCSYSSIAQSFELEFDHTTVLVKNLDSSAAFYTDILHLKELETPWGVIDWGKFFEIGNNQQLHMALVGTDGIKLNKMTHIAFAVNDFDAYLKFLDSKGIEWGNFKGKIKEVQLRPDDVRQVYFQDPDGLWIEVNDAKH